jgi:hypothetical protein
MAWEDIACIFGGNDDLDTRLWPRKRLERRRQQLENLAIERGPIRHR